VHLDKAARFQLCRVGLGLHADRLDYLQLVVQPLDLDNCKITQLADRLNVNKHAGRLQATFRCKPIFNYAVNTCRELTTLLNFILLSI